jgi:hypothetical protein
MNTALYAIAWKSWTEGGRAVLAEHAQDRTQLEPALRAGVLIEEAGNPASEAPFLSGASLYSGSAAQWLKQHNVLRNRAQTREARRVPSSAAPWRSS